jgi:beta-lactamase superfamily II metal-dependent hydrolase
MRRATFLLALLLAALPLAARDLEIYFVDVEGGQATLIVTPAGKSMLVDAGWPGNNGRDARRIAAAAKLAGINQIDYMLVTHYHLDHVGGVPELAAILPIVTYVDHGPNTETDAPAMLLSVAYAQVMAKGKHLVVRPGDQIPLAGVDVRVVAARGATIKTPLEGAGAANPTCGAVSPQPADPTENARSVAFLLTYGKFRFADFGDLTWNTENALVCPANLLGASDLYLVTHHGADISNSPAMLSALRPRVAIMNNGANKGGTPRAWWRITHNPGLEDLWQLHYSVAGGPWHNPQAQFIANPETAACQGHWIKVTARSDGSFTVTNGRDNFSKTYAARK